MPVLATSLDEPAATYVRGLWDGLEKKMGLRGVRKVPFPHITWLGCEALDTPRLVKALDDLGPTQAPVRAKTPRMGIFLKPLPVIYLAIERTPAVDTMHQKLWDIVEPCAEEMHGLYSSARWIPHVTLAQGDLKEEQVPEAVDLLKTIEFPLNFTFKNLTLFHWIGPRFEPIERFPLTGQNKD